MAMRVELLTLYAMLFLRMSTVAVRALAPPYALTVFTCRQSFPFAKRTRSLTSPCYFSASSSGNDNINAWEPMPENLYREWSLEQDTQLWENMKLPLPELASLLGRGLRGVEERLKKLNDVNSKPYERIFAEKNAKASDNSKQKIKLVPCKSIIERIRWSLPVEDFSIVHYDRVDQTQMESTFSAPNDSIKGSQHLLIDAIPEHRILAIKYRERIVWDREKRTDLVYCGDGIDHVIATYDDWLQRKIAAEKLDLQRQAEVSNGIREALGSERFEVLQDLLTELQDIVNDPTISTKKEVEQFVENGLDLFREAMSDASQVDPAVLPKNDYEALDSMSELTALLPDNSLRPIVLSELARNMELALGKKKTNIEAVAELPELVESDLVETFVKGSGPGGQKVNKTSNRVALLHVPTQIRIECQDTRSLQQNRKIVRKRLRMKLDDHFNGKQSREQLKADKVISKKAKAQARSRKRQRQKQQEKETNKENLQT